MDKGDVGMKPGSRRAQADFLFQAENSGFSRTSLWGVTHPVRLCSVRTVIVPSSSTPQCEASGKVYSAVFDITAAATTTPMIALDPVIFRELPVIQQIIVNETWLEAERRGCYVYADDRVVRENVCLAVLRIGEQLRQATERALAKSQASDPCPDLPEAA